MMDWKKLTRKDNGDLAAQETPSPLLPPETPSTPPAGEDDNPFAAADDDTAIDTIMDLIHSNEHDAIKSVLKETLGITGVQIHGDYARATLGEGSKTEMFDRGLAHYLYIHSMGFKGTRATQAFDALKQQITNSLFPDGPESKRSKVLGRA